MFNRIIPLLDKKRFKLPTSNLTLDLDSRYKLYTTAGGTTPAISDGDLIGRWEDNSGVNNHFTQSTALYRPVLKLNQLAGLPTIQMANASTQYLIGPAASNIITASAWSIYIVGKVTAVSTNVTAPGSYYTNAALLALVSGGYAGIVLRSAPAIHLYNYDGTEDVINGTLVLNTWYRIHARHLSGSIYFSMGDASESTAASGNTATANTTLLGRDGTAGLTGQIARCLIYNVGHSSVQKAAVMNYLKSIYKV